MGYLYMTLLQISYESNSERILKIGQYLVKLWARVRCLVFLTHSVAVADPGGVQGVQTPALFLDAFLKRTHIENMSLRFLAKQGAS